jgi:hypothetical protein
MTEKLRNLLDLLDLERIEQDIYRGDSHRSVIPRVFGGQVAAQALVAACRTVPAERLPHSLHCHDITACWSVAFAIHAHSRFPCCHVAVLNLRGWPGRDTIILCPTSAGCCWISQIRVLI